MIGMIVLILLGVYLLFIRKATAAVAKDFGIEGSPIKVFLLGIFLLLVPFTDEIVGRAQFAYECKKVEGYTVTDAIQNAIVARNADELATEENLHTFIPINKGSAFVVDGNTGAILFSYTNLHTPGGWLMRAGLNFGGLSSCNPVSMIAVMEAHGFESVKAGFFKRIKEGK